MNADRALGVTGRWLDDRLRGARGARAFLRKVFPDHWSFLLGEIALYSFIILLLTGTFLTLFFQPSMTDVVYHGSYTALKGVRMSEAYASTLNISFDVRGGLLIRQIHHWAADLFMAAIMVHMLRIFFTGAYRKPREFNWLIGIVLFNLGLVEGLFGYSLPDDALSGVGIRVLYGVLLAIPVVGSYLAFFLFGGAYPGHDIIPRLYILHVLLIPGLLLALITAHLILMFWQKHTQMPGKGRTNSNVVGVPTYPYFMAKTGAFFFFTFGALALLATVTQINPVWLYGPYSPAAISADSQPDFYMGFLEGTLRIFPNWTWDLWGHTVAVNVLVPTILPLALLFGLAAFWPFLERWIIGDRSEHHVNDRPRNAATRTAIGVAAITFYGVFWLEGANDLIATHLQVSLYLLTEIARYAVFLAPMAAYLITKRICLGLQRRDLDLLQHGVETGIIRQRPSGEYLAETRPLTEEEAAALAIEARPRPAAVPAAPGTGDSGGVPSVGTRSALGRLRMRLNEVLTESVPVNGHSNGYRTSGQLDQPAAHPNGHAAERQEAD
jgi:ubiquinol-cytochrome c reductase cytochrome b subunit